MKEIKHYFDGEMISKLSEKFDPEEFVKGLDVSEAEDILSSKSAFEEYGEKLIKESITLGEKNKDRIFELMENAAEKTGELEFPLFPERYIELAYLSIQPIKRLWVNANSPELFSFEIKDCNIHKSIKEKLGQEAADKMACKETCFKIIEGSFDYFDFDIEKSMPKTMAQDEKCLFEIEEE